MDWIVKTIRPARAVSLMLALFFSMAIARADEFFVSECPNDDLPWCAAVGLRAFNSIGITAVREIDLGPILGIMWRGYGDPLKPLPSARHHFADRSSYYYIIGPGGVADYTFLRAVDEIAPR